MSGTSFGDRLRAWFGLPPQPAVEGGRDVTNASSRAPEAQPPQAKADDTANDAKLPPSALKRVKAIRAMIDELEVRAKECGLFEEMLELERLRGNHLPRLIASYVDIPNEHRAEVFRETGRSASYLLNERLDKILTRLNEMSRQLARGNIDAFAENMRFVDTRYGSTSPFD